MLAAARALAELSRGGYVHLSSLYETTPLDCGPMADFVNAVAKVRPLHPLGELLNRVQAIERLMGRRSGHNEPRELDIDIIAVGSRVRGGGDLTLPHPRYASRAFVLIPLREIAASFQCPATGRHIDELVAGLPSLEGIRKISSRAILRQEVV